MLFVTYIAIFPLVTTLLLTSGSVDAATVNNDIQGYKGNFRKMAITEMAFPKLNNYIIRRNIDHNDIDVKALHEIHRKNTKNLIGMVKMGFEDVNAKDNNINSCARECNGDFYRCLSQIGSELAIFNSCLMEKKQCKGICAGYF